MKVPPLLPKLKSLATRAGGEITKLSLTLWYCALDKDTPMRLKLVIFGDLAYVLNPFDVIPDAVPIIGWSDDLAVLAVTMGLLAIHIKDEHRTAALNTMARWIPGTLPASTTPAAPTTTAAADTPAAAKDDSSATPNANAATKNS